LTFVRARGIVAFVTSEATRLHTDAQVEAGEATAPPPPSYVVTNETNRKLEIVALDGGLLVLAPLEVRECVSPENVERFALRRWGDLVQVEEVPATATAFKLMGLAVVFGLSVWGAPAWTILGALVSWPRWWALGWLVLAAAFVVGLAIDLGRNRRSLDFGIRSVRWARSWGGQQLNLLLSLLIGIVLPGAAIFFGTNILDLIDEIRTKGINEHEAQLTLIGRVMQLVFIATASLLPALLFFLFDREHLATLRSRFLRQIMRFDPMVKTRSDVIAKYGDLMDEAYGRDVSGRILPGRRSPLLLATLVVTFGWTLTLLHGDLVRLTEDAKIITLFDPRNSPVCFGFLGAYFYGINAILRGYVRKDLRPKTYSTLTVRIFVVVVLAWVFDLVLGGEQLYLLAFLAGIVPETALVLLKEAVRDGTQFVVRQFSALDERDPLTNLEGIDLYDRARLFDEGVTNVESLAHHDLVELMLQTRIPVPRLLDWTDQAILYLHAGPRREDGDGPTRAKALETLRQYGLRTATDLDNAFDSAETRRELNELVHILDGEKPAGPARLRVIKEALEDEEWMVNLRHWRDLENVVLEPKRLEVKELAAP
jgi:hypothetical protein